MVLQFYQEKKTKEKNNSKGNSKIETYKQNFNY